MKRFHPFLSVLILLTFLPSAGIADDPAGKLANFQRSSLVAWCIVPFDAEKRGPAARAEMIKRLGLRRVAYDWRAEHVPTFEDEIEQYKKHEIEFFAFWNWHDAIEPLIRKHGIKPQIWITLREGEGKTNQERVAAAARSLLPMVDKTRRLDLKLGLYNHGGWGGEPENMVAVCNYLRKHHQGGHVGIVYNFHHGHGHITGFQTALESMAPLLLCLNLNGMADPSTVRGSTNKIVPIGDGKHEREMIDTIIRNGYSGPIGILDHRNDTDSEIALRQNLDGLEKVIDQL